MADQVNPTGNLALGLSLSFTAALKPLAVQEKPRATKPIEPAPKGPEDRRVDESASNLDIAVTELKSYLEASQANLLFKVDEGSGQTFFKIIDARTQEVIRQVPSEEILAMARKLRELATPKGAQGVLVDKEG